MNKALFLDRDGVINIDHGYVCTPERFELVEGILDVMKWFQAQGYLLIIITNQAGIAKGHYTEEQFLAFDTWMRCYLKEKGIEITRTYYCPFHLDGIVKNYQLDSFHRKPNPGMFLDAITDWQIDPAQSLVIGDKPSDLEAGIAAGIKTGVLMGGTQEQNHIAAKTFPVIRRIYSL